MILSTQMPKYSKMFILKTFASPTRIRMTLIHFQIQYHVLKFTTFDELLIFVKKFPFNFHFSKDLQPN